MITESQAAAAIQSLIDNAGQDSQNRAERLYLVEYRKSLKSQIMREDMKQSAAAQEARAYADPRYIEHLDAMRTAIARDEKAHFLRDAAQAQVDAWRTAESSKRILKV